MATVNKAFKVKNGLIVDGVATDVVIGADTLPEVIQDTVGAMVTSNTESGIAVTYDDGTGKLNFDVSDPTISLTGDITGSATMTNLGNVSITTTIGANSVALGTDTTGDYVAGVTASGSGISVSGTGEGASVIVSNTGVTAIAGTTNEIEVSGSTGSITVGLPNNVTVGGTLTVTGDLTVNGTTTTLNTADLFVEDNIIVLNSGITGTPSLDSGIEIERGTSTNAKLYWNETADKWYVDNGTGSGAEIATGGSLNIFGTISDGSNTATPDSFNDTLTFAAGTGLSVAVNGTTDTVTYSLNPAADAAVASITLPNSKIEDGTVTSSGTSVVMDTFALATYKSAKYVVQMTNAGGDAHIVEVLVTAVTTNAYVVEYGELITNASLGDVTADSNGTTVTVSVGSTASGVVVKHTASYIEA